MAEYITRYEQETDLLDESTYKGFYYNGFIYYIGRNSIVRNALNTDVFEKVYEGTVYNGIGILCGSRFIMPELYTSGSTVTTGGNFGIRFHIYDAETGQYTPNAYDQYIYTRTTYFYYCSVMGTLYYNEQTHLLYIYYGRLYAYPVPDLEPVCTTVNIDTMTVVDKRINMSAVPLSGQPFDNVYLGSCVGGYSWNYRAEWGDLNNRTLSNAVSDPTITTGLKGFVHGDNIYLVGGGLEGYYNHKLVSIHRTTHIKTVLYDNEPFADSYAVKVDSDYYIPSLGKVIRYSFTPYPNTFKVYDSLGAELASLSDVPPIRSVSLHADGEYNQNAALTLVDVLNHLYTLRFQPTHTSTSNWFIGLSTGPGAPPSIMVGQTYDVPLESTSFYVVYGDPTPQNVIVGYQMSCEKNVVYKGESLTEVARYSGTFRSSISVTDPVFTITNLGMPAFNYIWIKALGRYYFVTDIVNIRTNLWEIHAHVDVLYTYRNAINGLQAHVTRSSRSFNAQLVDAALPTPVFSEVALQPSYLYEGEENPLSPLEESGYHYLLTAIRRG